MFLDYSFEALTREGVLISVSVRFWRAAKKLQAADLGLVINTILIGLFWRLDERINSTETHE